MAIKTTFLTIVREPVTWAIMNIQRQDDDADFFISKTHGEWTDDLTDVLTFTQEEKSLHRLTTPDQTWINWTWLLRGIESSKMAHPTYPQSFSKPTRLT